MAKGWGRVAAVSVWGASAAILATLAALVKVPANPDLSAAASGRLESPSLVISRVDALPVGKGLREQFWLLNPAPLYLPMSDGVGPRSLSDRPGGRAADMFPPVLLYSASRPGSGLFKPEMPVSAAQAAGDLLEPRWFSGMTRESSEDNHLFFERGRAARMTVYDVGAHRAVASDDLISDDVLEAVVWRPVELTAVVNEIGAVARPSLVIGSGDEQADERIRDLVGRQLLPKLSLRPGIYRIEVGP